MKHMTRLFRVSLVGIVLLLAASISLSQDYVLVGWNDLGMHCSNKNFGKIAVLPPFNNVNAQLILKSPELSPQIVTSGYTIEYSIPNNTYSVGKTDFWTYAQQLFGLSSPLPANIGLTGKGLTGVLDSNAGYFGARGIPLTPFADSDHVNENPFQLIHLVAKRTADGSVLATTDAVIPVSNEVGCVQSGCHSSEADILNSHDDVSGFNRNGPVLCASCHASNALGTTGIPEARPFSYRIHSTHSGIPGASNSIAACYKCHPGPKTQCLRDIMGKNPTNPLICQNCHGPMDSVASTIQAGRKPWLDEPKCGNCHGATFAEEPGKLFRQSVGHGGLFCSACHGSPHAIQPTIQPNDNIQNTKLQGFAGTLKKCSVCHATPPTGPGPHGIVDSTLASAPVTPILLSPFNGVGGVSRNPALHWQTTPFAATYSLQVATDSFFTLQVFVDSTLTQPTRQLPALAGNQTYYWRVQAKNVVGTSAWSTPWSFTTTSAYLFTFGFDDRWNIVSLPMTVADPGVRTVFPLSTTSAYRYNPAGGYEPKDSLTPGVGYWVRLSGTQLVNFTGFPVAAETIDVASGWNLIGSVIDTVSQSSLVTIPPGIINSSLFGYHGGYTPSTKILPSQGYWIRTSDAGKIILSAGTASPTPMALGVPTLDGYQQLVVTDALGRSRTLYFTDQVLGGNVLKFFEMPPVPPQGAFDVRFSSGRFVEAPEGQVGKSLDLQVSSAVYPLEVSWDCRPGTQSFFIAVGGTSIAMKNKGSVVITSAAQLPVLSLGELATTPLSFILAQNIPNPFNPTTSILYTLPLSSHVRIRVYNTLGQVVATLVDRDESPGEHAAAWDAAGIATGVYFYRIEAVGTEDHSKIFVAVKKMAVVR